MKQISFFPDISSLGGNLLINVGPTAYGMIAPEYEERLRQMGQWLDVNGEAIYKTHPWIHQNDTATPDVWYVSLLHFSSFFLLCGFEYRCPMQDLENVSNCCSLIVVSDFHF